MFCEKYRFYQTIHRGFPRWSNQTPALPLPKPLPETKKKKFPQNLPNEKKSGIANGVKIRETT